MEHTPSSLSSAERVPDELLDRYLLGRVTVEEQRAVEDGMRSVPEFAVWVSAVRVARSPREGAIQIAHLRRRIREEAGLGTSGRRLEHVLSRGRVFMRESSGGTGVGGIGFLGRKTLRRWGWAGSLTALITAMWLLMVRIPASQTDVMRVYGTGAQQQAVIDLPDGTRVTLSPRTILRLQRFGPTARTVVLDRGEAYFDVVPASHLPFFVRSGTTVVQVLGTAFLVRHPADATHVRVAVANGKVRVTAADRGSSALTLTAGQVGNVTDSTIQMSAIDDPTPDVEWAPGHIMFRHTPVTNVLQTVSQWYGYHFRYADQTLGTQRVTIMVSTQSSAKALATLERLLEVNLSVVGDTVTLVPQPRPSQSVPRMRTYDVWTPTSEVGR